MERKGMNVRGQELKKKEERKRCVLGTPKTKRNTEGTRGRREKAETRTNRASFHFGGIRVNFLVDFFFFFFFFATEGWMLVYTFDTKCVLVKRKARRMRHTNKVNTKSKESFLAKVRG